MPAAACSTLLRRSRCDGMIAFLESRRTHRGRCRRRVAGRALERPTAHHAVPARRARREARSRRAGNRRMPVRRRSLRGRPALCATSSLCHCAMCRKTHGHFGAYTAAPKAALRDRRIARAQMVRVVAARAARLLRRVRRDAVLGPARTATRSRSPRERSMRRPGFRRRCRSTSTSATGDVATIVDAANDLLVRRSELARRNPSAPA